jgi:predicted dienelactone hydrolase
MIYRVIFLLSFSISPLLAADYSVGTSNLNLHDSARNRNIPLKIYYPKTSKTERFPVIVFSHGLGGSREGYGYLGRHWAGHGYIVVHLQHAGSDSEVWQNVPPGQVMQAMRRAAVQPGNAVNRVKDVTFAIDQLESLNKQPGPLQGRLDMNRIGVGGHSFGAMTSLAVAGETFITAKGEEVFSPDHRVKAALALSAPVPKNKDRWKSAFATIQIPCLHMTGTEDNSPLGETSPEERRVPFDYTFTADAYLIIFQGGDHMVFSGMTRNAARVEKDALIHGVIKDSSLAFWDAYLRGDAAAKAWLTDGDLAKRLSATGTFEKKLVTTKREP